MKHALGNGMKETLMSDQSAHDAGITEKVDRLEAEIDRLRSGIQAILDGNYPNPRKHRPGKCPHGMAYYEACENCVDDALSALITHVAGQGGTLGASDTPAAPSGGLDGPCACGRAVACLCGVVG